MSKKKRISGLNIIAYIVLTFMAVLMIFPFYWMIITSMKTGSNILKIPPDFYVWPVSFENYMDVFQFGNIFGAFKNSLTIAIFASVGTLFSCSLAAFAFEKIDFAGRNKIFAGLLATMMIPSQLTLIPLYMIFSKIGWTNSFLPLIVPTMLLNAYGVFLIKSFMVSIPDDYIESAYLDGANPFKTYYKIALPLCKPVMVTLGLFTFIGAWNDFMGALIYLDDERKFTLTLLLSTYRSQYNINWGNIMAASTVAIIPILILYIFAQRFFVEGITMSGLKG